MFQSVFMIKTRRYIKTCIAYNHININMVVSFVETSRKFQKKKNNLDGCLSYCCLPLVLAIITTFHQTAYQNIALDSLEGEFHQNWLICCNSAKIEIFLKSVNTISVVLWGLSKANVKWWHIARVWKNILCTVMFPYPYWHGCLI